MPPERIASGIDDMFRLLTGGARTAMPRQQTLEASIEWSHDLLDDAERTVLHRLGVFIGGFTSEAAEHVVAAFRSRPLRRVRRVGSAGRQVARDRRRERALPPARDRPCVHADTDAIGRFGGGHTCGTCRGHWPRSSAGDSTAEFPSEAVDAEVIAELANLTARSGGRCNRGRDLAVDLLRPLARGWMRRRRTARCSPGRPGCSRRRSTTSRSAISSLPNCRCSPRSPAASRCSARRPRHGPLRSGRAIVTCSAGPVGPSVSAPTSVTRRRSHTWKPAWQQHA